MLDEFIKVAQLKKKDPDAVRLLPSLVLAYVGDAVYELFVRTYLLHKYDYPVHKLHEQSVRFVNAASQSEIVHALEGEWSEEEKRIIKRGRNQKSGSVPKNAALMDYKYATGFETLIGYLFLTGQMERLTDIIYKSLVYLEELDRK